MSATSEQTGATSPRSNSTLSAEAAEFVPAGCFTQGESSDGSQQGGRGKSLAEIPRYLTTCYPFVNPASTQRGKVSAETGAGAAVGGGRAFVSGQAYSGNIRQPCPHLGLFPTPVGFPPSAPQPWLPGLQPAPAFTPALPMATLTPGVHMPFDGGTPTLGRGLLPTPSKGDGLLPTPPFPPISNSALLAQPVMMPYNSSQLLLPADSKMITNTAKNRQGQPGSGRGRGTNVSRGTQRETFSVPSGGRSHTIIMKDTSVQTDFNLDIADLTLQEKPSVLYRRGQRKNKGSQPIASTDSEEVDSDSGYSSPLHRRNLVSNGTHPVRVSSLVEMGECGKSSAPLAERGKSSAPYANPASKESLESSPGRAQHSRTVGMAEAVAAGDAGTTHRSQKESARSSPVVWGKESGSSVPANPDSNRPSPALWSKDSPGKGITQGLGNKERSRTPVSFRDSQRLEEEGGKVMHAHEMELRSAGSTVKHMQSSSGSITSSRETPAKLSQSPGSSRRDSAPSPAPPEFPILKPAKRNEPPWSLTPNLHKGKKGESSGFLGMVAESVKSYASIVKSLSSPSNSQSSTATAQPQSSQTPTPGEAMDHSKAGEITNAEVDEDSIPGGATGSSAAGSAHSQGGRSGSTQAQLGVWGSGKKAMPAWGGGQKTAEAGGGGARQELGVWVGRTDPGVQPCGAEPVQPVQVRPQPQGVGGARIGGAGMDTGLKGAETRDISKQRCDTLANRLGAEEGREPSLPPNSSRSVTTGQKVRAASPSKDNPHPNSSPHRSLSGGRSKTDSARQPSAASGDEKTEDEGKKRPRRRRHRRRRRKTKSTEGEGLSDGMSGMERTVSSSNISRTSDVTLHFEDELEFPEIGAASGNEGVSSSGVHDGIALPAETEGLAFRRAESTSSLSYSDILRRKPSVNDVRSRTQSAPGSCLSGEEGGDENFNSQPGQGSLGQTPLSKRARKRRKRRELANRAAEAELAEITLEQQMLRHKVSSRGSRPSSGSRDERSRSRDEKSPLRGLITDPNVVKQSKVAVPAGGGSGKKLHQPIALNIADMLDAFEKKKSKDQKSGLGLSAPIKKSTLTREDSKKSLIGNLLDTNAPSKRGKERETPKPKKPSPLKKVILKEREEKKRMRMIGDCDYADVDIPNDPDPDPDTDAVDPEQDLIEESNTGNPVGLGESDLSQDGLSSRSVDTDQGVSPGADLSPISQTSPLSMSPLTPGASPLNSPIAGYLSRDPVVLRIHSRRFREYCTQILDKDIDTCCTSLLHELVRFQDRMYHKDPNKAKGKRRVVLGLREVTKHLKLKKIKCVIISPNLEKIQSKGGLDEALNNILNMCQEQNVPFVFALGRRALGRACAKLVPVSVAGIFNYEGCEEKFNQLISLTHKGREAYSEMVQAVEREIAENPPPSMSAGSSLPSLYAHMGHSRTPSGCSAISFTSSVLSEPISENYPHAEPETDSKGYEIVRDKDGKVIPPGRGGNFQNGGAIGSYQPSVDDFDDGNEADTEDINDYPPQKRSGGSIGKKVEDLNVRMTGCKDVEVNRPEISVAAVNHIPVANHVEKVDARHTHSGDEDIERHDMSEDGDSVSESDSQRLGVNLPHIDSIHSNTYDLSTEILSQHSSRTVDNSEVLSTHSSRTLGDGSLTPNTEHGKDRPQTPESSGKSGRSTRLMNKDRVQNWVENCVLEEQGSACEEGTDSEEEAEGEVRG